MSKKPHIHENIICEWAMTGKCVQYFEDGEWHDTEHPSWSQYLQYRFKPEVKRYRVALFSTFTATADNLQEAESFSERSNFIRWITDWKEYDV